MDVCEPAASALQQPLNIDAPAENFLAGAGITAVQINGMNAVGSLVELNDAKQISFATL